MRVPRVNTTETAQAQCVQVTVQVVLRCTTHITYYIVIYVTCDARRIRFLRMKKKINVCCIYTIILEKRTVAFVVLCLIIVDLINMEALKDHMFLYLNLTFSASVLGN